MPGKLSSGKVRRVYEFIKDHSGEYDVKTMFKLLEVTRSGYYAWLREPISRRAQEEARLLRLIRASFTASHGDRCTQRSTYRRPAHRSHWLETTHAAGR